MALGSLTIDIGASIARLESDLGKARGQLDKFGRDVKTIGGAIGIAIGADAFVGFIKGTIDAADELNDLSKKFGTTASALAGFKLAAAQSGASMEDIAKGLKAMSTELATNPDRMRSLGITTKDSTSALIQFADVIASMPDDALRTNLAIEVLKKSGVNLIPMLMEGSRGLQAMVDSGTAASGMTDQFARDADRFNDRLALMKTRAGAVGVAIAENLFDALDELSKKLKEADDSASPLLNKMLALAKLPWDAVFPTAGRTGALATAEDELESVTKKAKALQAQLNYKPTGTDPVKDFLMKLDADGVSRATNQLTAYNQQILLLKTRIDSIKNPKKPIEEKPVSDPSVAKAAECVAKGGRMVGGSCVLPDQPKTQGQSFVEGLKKRLVGIKENEYAMLRLEAAEKGVSASAEPIIKAIEAESRARQLLIDKQEAQARNDERMFARDTKDIISDPKAIDDFVRSLDEENEALRFQQEMLTKTRDEVDLLTKAREIELQVADKIRAAEQDGMVMSEANVALLRQQAEQKLADYKNYIEQRKVLDNSLEQGAKLGAKSYQDSLGSVAERVGQVWNKAFKGMEDALVNFVKTGKLNFNDLASSIIDDLIRIQIQESITGPLSAAMKSGSLFAALGFAAGGRPPVGVPSIVGEKGPEIFVPDAAGTIIPNNIAASFPRAIGELGGGNSVVVQVSVDARGADSGAADRVAGSASKLADTVRGIVQGELIKQRRNGGMLA